MPLTPETFPQFFEAVHGYEPFPWQARLARQVSEQGWPDVLSLPTAAGKTSVIDIAAFALALQAEKPIQQRSAPLRIFFVIDRRLVVDQAAGNASTLKAALNNPKAPALVRQVADALRQFGGSNALNVATLRGGMYRDDSWAKAPNQPTICVTTVDQVGSRLLFRGYGVSEFARPVHAGLTGNDALYLVDEAHLSQPFLETLRSVQFYRGAEQSDTGPFRVVEISATPQSEVSPFTLSEVDRTNAELARRLAAPKPAKLMEPVRFEQEAAEFAVNVRSGDIKVIGVVVNRIASAREIFTRLPGEEFEDKVLLTGRIRPWGRDKLLARFLERVRAGRERKPEDKPLFVVATMTVEVGADIDFDYLVTEAAPLPALRQRFGRLDRLGRFGKAGGAILLRRANDSDPIYGSDLEESWKWLKRQAESTAGVIDFGVDALDELIRNAGESPPAPAQIHAPSLFPAHLDCLVQTSPAPEPSPDVAPFLHGAEALNAADVQLVWRADLPIDRVEDWFDIVRMAPPKSQESLPIPVYAVRKWLEERSVGEVADIEGIGSEESDTEPGRPALRWHGMEKSDSRVVSPGEIFPGDTVIVPASYGGADAFGWHPEATNPVEDVADLCTNQMANSAPDDGRRRLIRMRLYSGVLSGLDVEQRSLLDQKTETLRALAEEGEDFGNEMEGVLSTLSAYLPHNSLMGAVIDQFLSNRTRATAYPAGVVLTARVSPGFFQPDASALTDFDEPDDSTDADDTGPFRPVAVTLEEHCDGVASWAFSFARGLRLDFDTTTAIVKAAHLHDLGKADPRFQFLLYGDEPDDVLLAKSGRDLDAPRLDRVRERSGLPFGYRHEFVSVDFVRRHAGELLDRMNGPLNELVEYLIGVHHGRGRPFVPVIEEDASEEVDLAWAGHRLRACANHGLWRLDSGWADGFWHLVRRHGYWSLAYLETILRLADMRRSAEEVEEAHE